MGTKTITFLKYIPGQLYFIYFFLVSVEIDIENLYRKKGGFQCWPTRVASLVRLSVTENQVYVKS